MTTIAVTPDDYGACPITQAILAACDVDSVEVTPVDIVAWRGCTMIVMDTPLEVARWIRLYDNGELVAPMLLQVPFPSKRAAKPPARIVPIRLRTQAEMDKWMRRRELGDVAPSDVALGEPTVADVLREFGKRYL